MSVNATRIAPLPIERWGINEHRAVAALWGIPEEHLARAGSGEVTDPLRFTILSTMAHHPRLAKNFFAFNRSLLFGARLSDRIREIVILRVAYKRTCAYEWGQHVKLGNDAGLTDAEIASIARFPQTTELSEFENTLLSAADDLVSTGRITDENWSRLSQELDTQELMELVFVVGCYSMLAMAFETFGLAPESDTQPLPTTT